MSVSFRTTVAVEEPLPLFAPTTRIRPRVISHREEWEAFRVRYPEVWDRIVHLAIAKGSRRMRFGIGQIWEILRWGSAFARDDRPFKLNNNWRAWAARDLVQEHPALAPFIVLRDTDR